MTLRAAGDGGLAAVCLLVGEKKVHICGTPTKGQRLYRSPVD